MKGLRAYALALGSGIIMGIIPAPVNAWYVAWFALAPLWWLIGQTKKVRSAMVLGALWGLGYHGAALSWITGLHPLTWMGISWLASVAIATLCWLIITLWGLPILMIWSGVVHWMTPRYPPCHSAPRRFNSMGLPRMAVGPIPPMVDAPCLYPKSC